MRVCTHGMRVCTHAYAKVYTYAKSEHMSSLCGTYPRGFGFPPAHARSSALSLVEVRIHAGEALLGSGVAIVEACLARRIALCLGTEFATRSFDALFVVVAGVSFGSNALTLAQTLVGVLPFYCLTALALDLVTVVVLRVANSLTL